MSTRFSAKNKSKSKTHISRNEKITKSKLNIKLTLPQKKKTDVKQKTTANKLSHNKLKLLLTIVSRGKAEYYMDLLQSFEVNMQIAILANGMAPQNIVELLGLTNNEKIVIASVIKEGNVPDALFALEQKFNTIKDGKGIAFTIPLTSVIGTLIYGFLSNNKMIMKEDK